MAGEKLVKLIQQTAQNAANSNVSTTLIFGEVISTTPLEIQVDSRYIINEDFIVLSSLCIEKTTNDRADGTILWRGLQVGDTVRMLRVQGGQLFYVLDREGGLTIL